MTTPFFVTVAGKKYGPYVRPAGYQCWREMRRRCTKQYRREYGDYGGRGISVCDRWANSFDNFLADMGPRPSAKHSIERIDNNRNYEPGNCRWAVQSEQARNTRANCWISCFGERLCIADWAERLGISPIALSARIRRFTKRRTISRTVDGNNEIIGSQEAISTLLLPATGANRWRSGRPA